MSVQPLTTPADTLPASVAALAPNGTWFLTCRDFVESRGRKHDLILEWRRRDGIFDRDCIGLTPTLVSSLHEFVLHLTADGTRIEAKGRIDPDPWVVIAGPVNAAIDIAAGTYRGTFADQPITGAATVVFEPLPPVSRGMATAPLQILQEFQRDGARGRLYDFAYAGRGTTDPSPGLRVFDATDFGLRPNSGQEALPAIQAALDAAGAAGGGVVQLPIGVLDCNVDAKLPPLRIRHDHVVLRGAGSGPEGTLLVNHRYSDTPEPDKPWRAGEHPLLIVGPDDVAPPQPLTRVLAGQRGELILQVDNAAGIHAGHTYLLRQLEVADGSLARDLTQGLVALANNWRGAGKELVSQIVTVLDVQGNTLTIDAPLHRSITRWPAELCAFPMLQASGVASLRMRGLWAGYFVHHKNGEHDNGWDQVKFVRVSGGWADDLIHENTTCAIGLTDCLGCIVRNCRIMGNPGHNGFVLNSRSTGNLMVGCHAGRNMHGLNIQGTLCGNAVVDCTMDEPSGIDFHGGIGCDNLFDALVGGVCKGGGSANAVPPRHGPGVVLWNWCCGHYDPYKPWQRQALAADTASMPGFIAVGVHGAYGQRITYAGPEGVFHDAQQHDWGWVESPGQRTAPRSLLAWLSSRKVGFHEDGQGRLGKVD